MDPYKKLLLIPFCVVVLLVMESCRKEKKVIESPQKEEKPTPVERLLSKDGKEIYEAQNELFTARKDLIGQLINIVKDKQNRLRRRASVRAAMFILGEMRAVEAVQVLVDHIGFPQVYEYTGESIPVDAEGGMLHRGIKGFQKTYPAVKALIKIGEPCFSDLISKLSSTDHMTEKKACLGVLVGLRQRDSVIEMLKDAIKKETDTQKKDRLQSSLDLLAQMEE